MSLFICATIPAALLATTSSTQASVPMGVLYAVMPFGLCVTLREAASAAAPSRYAQATAHLRACTRRPNGSAPVLQALETNTHLIWLAHQKDIIQVRQQNGVWLCVAGSPKQTLHCKHTEEQTQ